MQKYLLPFSILFDFEYFFLHWHVWHHKMYLKHRSTWHVLCQCTVHHSHVLDIATCLYKANGNLHQEKTNIYIENIHNTPYECPPKLYLLNLSRSIDIVIYSKRSLFAVMFVKILKIFDRNLFKQKLSFITAFQRMRICRKQ